MGEDKIVYKKESYKIVGYCFEVYNQIGPGHREKTYQRALEELLKSDKVEFESQQYVPIKINGKTIDKHYLDLLIDDKIALELKVGDHFSKRDIDQLYSYLKSTKIKLGILVNFARNGVTFRRVLNKY